MRLFLQRLGSAFAYTTVRQVKVHSVTVGLLYLTLVVAISAYVVGYEFFLGESKVAAAEAEEGAGRLTRGLGAQWPRRARQKRTAKSKRGGKRGSQKKSSRIGRPLKGSTWPASTAVAFVPVGVCWCATRHVTQSGANRGLLRRGAAQACLGCLECRPASLFASLPDAKIAFPLRSCPLSRRPWVPGYGCGQGYGERQGQGDGA